MTAIIERLKALQDWLREPDHAEHFGTDQIIDWINRRPTHVVTEALLAALESATPAISETPVSTNRDSISGAGNDFTQVAISDEAK